MGLMIDHIVILGQDLDQAIADYEALGFQVMPGGKHPRFTHNALVTFADSAYLELIAFHEMPDASGDDGTHRWVQYVAQGGGLIDFAVAADDLDGLLAEMAANDGSHRGPVPGARNRPDGVEIAWKMGQHRNDIPNTGHLPFLIQDVTPRELRVPPEGATHANGVRGVHSLVVAVTDLNAAVARYSAMVGSGPVDATIGVDDARTAAFDVGPHQVVLAEPTGAGVLRDEIARKGEGPFELRLLAGENTVIEPGTASGARLRFITG